MKQLIIVLLAVVAACNASAITARQGSFNKYYVYTRENTRTPVSITLNSILASPLARHRRTVILVDGHGGSLTSPFNNVVKDAYLTCEDANVVIVDWSTYALLSYSNAVGAVPSVGTHLGSFIRTLVATGVVSLDRLHLVGFDLGAHVVGFAGRHLNGEVARITGLSPSASQWGSSSQRLRRSDAVYVEGIHTDARSLLGNGVGDPIGHADIYANGGTGQPGCFLSHQCSHIRAWELFAASLTHNHLIANLCGSWRQMTSNSCRGFTLTVGTNQLDKLGSGIYRTNTKRTYPY